ncbi:hypothetical protein GIB67_014686 [Kingdonia uniflora]|uniref:Uncharacterized protein n=1 Tax=Kingdonia uniflora TaxID=39325 RepID=A0A7J7L4V3_9MAGN|nr:hypothetical protein GIB67_014686 [Kingdonia uniflora]
MALALALAYVIRAKPTGCEFGFGNIIRANPNSHIESPNSQKISSYLFHGGSTQHSQNDTSASIPIEATAPEKEKGKGRKKRASAKQRQRVQVPEDAEFLDETDDAGMIGQNRTLRISEGCGDHEFPTRRSCGSTKSQWYALNAQCVTYKGIVAQERFRNNSGKIEEDREKNAHKIYQGLNGGNHFKYREAYKILAR